MYSGDLIQNFRRPFHIFCRVALSEILAVKLDGDADFQNSVIEAALIQIGSSLHHGERDVGGDNHWFAGQQPLVTTSNTRSLPKLVFRSAPRSSKISNSGRISVFR